jgi:hypothetical protein
MHIYADILQIQDQNERKKRVREYVQANPAFATFAAYLKR